MPIIKYLQNLIRQSFKTKNKILESTSKINKKNIIKNANQELKENYNYIKYDYNNLN